MDRIFYVVGLFVEMVGMVLFIASAVFAILAGVAYQIFFKRRKKVVEAPKPPITPAVESAAEKAGEAAGAKPGQSTVDFFNELGKP